MTISVVIPTCDRPEFLPETLESVFGQTRKPDEVVVVNNGPAEAQLPAEFSNWIRVLDIIPYAGACQARNFGASTVSGDLIAFIDDDDIWADDYLANVEAAFAADDVACTVSRLDTLRDGKIEPWKCADGLMTKANLMTFNPGITGSNVVISKEAFFAVRGYNPQLRTGEDKSLILELLRSGRTVATLPKNQVCIRDHRGVRLSNHAKMADGVNDFYHNYADDMTWRQRAENRVKIWHYRWKAGQRLALVPRLWNTLLLTLTGGCPSHPPSNLNPA